MSTPAMNPGSEPTPSSSPLAARLLRSLGLLLLVAGVSAASAYGVYEWRMQTDRAALTAMREQTVQEVADLRTEMQGQQDALQAEMKRVEEAAEATGLLLQKDGEVTGLQSRLAEIDTLKLELRKSQEELDTKLKGLEQTLKDQVAQAEKETAQALAIDMKVRNLLVKAQGEVLLAQVHWAEGNRGMAKDELGYASRSLQQALTESPEASKEAIKKVVDAAEQCKTALILESSSSRDSLNLLWHQVGDLLAEK